MARARVAIEAAELILGKKEIQAMNAERDAEIGKVVAEVNRNLAAGERQIEILNRLYARSDVLNRLFWELYGQLTAVFEPGDPTAVEPAAELVVLQRLLKRTNEEIEERHEFMTFFAETAVWPSVAKMQALKKALEKEASSPQ